MIKKLRSLLRNSKSLRLFVANKVVPLGLFDSYFKNYSLSGLWQQRLNDVVNCEDNKYISRVPNAGEIVRGNQIMHNGLKINLGSYYGPELTKILYENKGVHEPQEERVFAEVVKEIGPSSTMVELGSFWSFYSMWFNNEVKGANNFMVEPSKFNIASGKSNFKLNSMTGNFTLAFVSKSSNNEKPVPTICVDDFVRDKNIDYIDILHSDIQGYEYEMLQGASNTINNNKVSFVFISTHSNEIHSKCLKYLQSKQFFIIAESDLDNSFSEDGLIVAHSPHITYNKVIEICKKLSEQ